MTKRDLKTFNMMVPEKAYIIAIDDDRSIEYAAHAVNSCKKVGLDFEIVQGIQDKTVAEAFATVDPDYNVRQKNMDPKAACATATHMMLWHRIAQNEECAIILEHDAVMLHPPAFEIPHNFIVTLGYKNSKPWAYDHEEAGPPRKIHQVYQHAGAHAYAITHVTARSLIEEIENVGIPMAIDNFYFMRNFIEPGLHSEIPMAIVDPICAMGWLRKSTIWEGEQSAAGNYTFLLSYLEHSDKTQLDDVIV